jgi:hypothetical protein
VFFSGRQPSFLDKPCLSCIFVPVFHFVTVCVLHCPFPSKKGKTMVDTLDVLEAGVSQ